MGKILIKRNTMIKGEVVAAGDVVVTDKKTAKLLIDLKKAVPYVESVKATGDPETATVKQPETAEKNTAGKKK